eukprot:CAMPEP_0195287156 /NCGR_PEP_ID=MMETSP0707-20130614/4335_1 /TAXON_ID=33640 /ORGANISM="Asterionellopsis glacialis, Strain CCMP134" /LENGTH=836 /DNA_ID=CAMNT_0040346885 /DNA_START=12 /DNA_END=2522 /DNA_ORIENTATION=+
MFQKTKKSLTAKLTRDKTLVAAASVTEDDEESNAYAAASVSSSEDSRAGLIAAIRHHSSVLNEDKDLLEGIDEDDLGGKPLRPALQPQQRSFIEDAVDPYQDDSYVDNSYGAGTYEDDGGETAMYSAQQTMYSEESDPRGMLESAEEQNTYSGSGYDDSGHQSAYSGSGYDDSGHQSNYSGGSGSGSGSGEQSTAFYTEAQDEQSEAMYTEVQTKATMYTEDPSTAIGYSEGSATASTMGSSSTGSASMSRSSFGGTVPTSASGGRPSLADFSGKPPGYDDDENDDETYPPPKKLSGRGSMGSMGMSVRSSGVSTLGSGSFTTRSSRLMASEGDEDPSQDMPTVSRRMSAPNPTSYDPNSADPRWSGMDDREDMFSVDSRGSGGTKQSGILRASKWSEKLAAKAAISKMKLPQKYSASASQQLQKQSSAKWAPPSTGGDDYTVDMSDDGQSRISFSQRTAHSKVATNVPLKNSTKVRAMLCLGCAAGSIVLSLMYGHGAAGLWMTNQFLRIGPGEDRVRVDGNGMVAGSSAAGGLGSLGPSTAYNGNFQVPDLASMNIMLFGDMEHYQDWTVPYVANRTDIPVLWTIPRAGGNVLIRILGQCLGLVQVSGEGSNHYEEQLQIHETPQGTRYVNVDSTTVMGLARAKQLGIAESGLAEVLYTNLIVPTSSVFSLKNRGRLFAVFRSPLERSVSLYHQAQMLDRQVAEMTMADYASTRLTNNEMVRTLVGKAVEEELTEQDLYMAMEFLRRKCVIGLADRIGESMQRIHRYFGWDALRVGGVQQCEQEFLAPNQERPALPPSGSEAFNYIMAQNNLDMRLYDYALYLFDYQGGDASDN